MSVDVGGAGSAKSEPNVVPLCDILLVLLIIFMVVTPMIKQGTNVTLPEARNTLNLPEPGKLVTVFFSDKGEINVEGDIVVIAKVAEKIGEKMEDMKIKEEDRKRVLLKVDEKVKYGMLADLLSALREGQIEVVGLVTKKELGSV